MYIDLTTLQMKVTKKQSISMAFQRLLRSFLGQNRMAVDLRNITGRYLQGPSLTTESILKIFFLIIKVINPIPENIRAEKGKKKKKKGHYPSMLILFYYSTVLSNYYFSL